MTPLKSMLFLLLLMSEMCLARQRRECDINAIWFRDGDNLTRLFGMDWEKVYRYRELPVVVRKGKPIKSPDLVPSGVLIQIPSNTWLSEEALARLTYYRSLCSVANSLIDSGYAMATSLTEDEANKQRLHDAELLLVAAESTMTNLSFDFKNFIVARTQAEQAVSLLNGLVRPAREHRGPNLLYSVLLIMLLLSLCMILLYFHGHTRNTKVSEATIVGRRRLSTIIVKELVIEYGGKRIALPLRQPERYVLRIGGPDGHLTSPNMPEELLRLETEGDTVFLRNSGQNPISVGEEAIKAGEVFPLSLYRPLEIQVDGSKLVITKKEKVIRPRLVDAHKWN
jgi:hypothetical protein